MRPHMLYFFCNYMGEKILFQPLTTTDRVTVLLYRLGIVLSSMITGVAGFLAYAVLSGSVAIPPLLQNTTVLVVLLFMFYFSVGLSVFFIHLYIGKLYRFLKRVFYLATACLIALVILGNGNPLFPLSMTPAYRLLLIPVAFCLGFVTAKEAFCFRLYEGYLLFGLMPSYLLFSSMRVLSFQAEMTGIIMTAALLVFFTLRKVFMPLHCDIGDKSAYTP